MSSKTRLLDSAALPLDPTDIVHVVQPGGDRQATVADLGGGGGGGGGGMVISLFTAIASLTLPLGTTIFQVSGYSVPGRGHALLIEDTSLTDADVAAHPRAIAKSFNNRYVRISLDQLHNPYMFGAVGDNATLDAAAFLGGLAYFEKYASNPLGSTFYRAVIGLHIKANDTFYLGATSFERFMTLRIWGDNSGLPDDYRSFLRFDDGVIPFLFERYNTSGATGTDAGTHTGADSFDLTGLYVRGGYTNVAAAEGEFPAIKMRCRGTVRRCNFRDFASHAVEIVADDSSPTYRGNANGWVVDTIFAGNCRTALYVSGGDGNAGSSNHVTAIACRQAGLIDISFLGNSHNDFWSEACGAVPGCYYAVWCSHAGNVYQVKWGQEAWCAANAPSGTTAHNTGWRYLYAGAPHSGVNRPAYAGGMTWRSGGPFVSNCINNPCTFNKPYMEGGEAAAQGAQAVAITHPQDGSGIIPIDGLGNPAILEAHQGNIRLRNTGLEVTGRAVTIEGDSTGTIGYFGPSAGPPVDTTTNFQTTNFSILWYFDSYGAGFSRDGSFTSFLGGIRWAGKTQLRLGIIGTDVIYLTSAGADLQSLPLLYAGTKIVAAPKAGWGQATGTADRTTFDTATVTTAELAKRFKALIDDLHQGGTAHGLLKA